MFESEKGSIKVNDDYGHITGDQCLIAVANCLKISMQRISDTVARYGGEEFVILLPGLVIFTLFVNLGAEPCWKRPPWRRHSGPPRAPRDTLRGLRRLYRPGRRASAGDSLKLQQEAAALPAKGADDGGADVALLRLAV